MRKYYSQTRCFYRDSFGKIKSSFIDLGYLEDYGEFVVYRELNNDYKEIYNSMDDFKRSMVYDIKDFHKYCELTEFV